MARRCCAQRNTSEIFRGVSEWAAQLVECRFHLERPDQVARGLDHVVAAPDEPVVTVGVATGDIAGALPAVHERLLVALVLVEIRPEHRGPTGTQRQFAGPAGVLDLTFSTYPEGSSRSALRWQNTIGRSSS